MNKHNNNVYYLEIVTPEVEAISELYALTQQCEFLSGVTELGNASVATLDCGTLVGIRAPMHSSEKAVVRCYFLVRDLVSAVQQASQLGATILLERMEIPGRGVIAIYELGGVEQGFWQKN